MLSGSIRTLNEKMFIPQNGDRHDAPNIVILITDGTSNQTKSSSLIESNKARARNIHILVVGIGNKVCMHF